jgi:hypothetical protein
LYCQHNNMKYKKCQQSASCPLVCDGVAIFFAEDVVEYWMSRETRHARKRHTCSQRAWNRCIVNGWRGWTTLGFMVTIYLGNYLGRYCEPAYYISSRIQVRGLGLSFRLYLPR